MCCSVQLTPASQDAPLNGEDKSSEKPRANGLHSTTLQLALSYSLFTELRISIARTQLHLRIHVYFSDNKQLQQADVR